MKKTIFSVILILGMTTATLWAEDAMQAQATPGPAQPEATETQSDEAKPVEVKLDKNARQAIKQEKAAQKQAEKAAQRQQKQAEKAAQKQQKLAENAANASQKNPGQSDFGREKGRPYRRDYKSDFDQSALKGNLANAFKKYPEFRQIVEKELALEAQSRELVKKFKNEKDASQKAELEKQLRDVVSQHFDARQARRLFELKIFEDRVQELRKQTEDRNGLKERIVDKRMMELIGTDEDLRF